VDEVAPGIGEQFRPDGSQSSHWYVIAGPGDPDHIPSEAVNVAPNTADPDTAGTDVFTGTPATTAVGTGFLLEMIGLGG
jgi:hypothetical protein